MLDPISAISLVSNIVQLIDVSVKVLSTATEYRGKGDTIRNVSLYRKAEQLRDLADTLLSAWRINLGGGSSPSLTRTSGLGFEQDPIMRIALGCKASAEEMTSALKKVKQMHDKIDIKRHQKKLKQGTRRPVAPAQDGTIEPSRNNTSGEIKYEMTAWPSFRAALSTVWNDKKIRQMEADLEEHRKNLFTHLIVNMTMTLRRLNLGDRVPDLQATAQRLEATCASFTRKLDFMKEAMLAAVVQQADLRFESNRLYSIRDADVDGKEAKAEQNDSFLKFLRFPGMHARRSVIHEAHPGTYEWAARHPALATWLTERDGIFWISGKPGSGKSTLMKYLFYSPEVKTCLDQWAQGNKLVTAGFFFWYLGSGMQKTLLGLLRTLLHDFLAEFPGLFTSVLSFQWAVTMDPNEEAINWDDSWDETEQLLQTLKQFGQQLGGAAKICIFIDGLDEYEGSPATLIEVVRVLSAISGWKLIVSSRPWIEFEKEYGDWNDRKLYMDRFNIPDIQLYVEESIGRHSHYKYLQSGVEQCDDIIEEVVERSQGVFLWVYLVVQDLTQGLDSYDRGIDLTRRLQRIPSGLKEFFRHMIVSLDPLFRIPTAKAFQMAVHSSRPMYMLNYWHLDLEEENPRFAIELLVDPYGTEKVAATSDLMAKRMIARWKGLLEPIKDPGVDFWFGPKIYFLHRTAKDYMASDEMQKLLEELHPTEDISAMLCRVILAQVKTVAIDEWHLSREGRMSDLVQQFMRSAASMEDTKSVELVDELIRVIEHWRKCFVPDDPQMPWICWPEANEAKNSLSLYRQVAEDHSVILKEQDEAMAKVSRRFSLQRFRSTFSSWKRVTNRIN